MEERAYFVTKLSYSIWLILYIIRLIITRHVINCAHGTKSVIACTVAQKWHHQGTNGFWTTNSACHILRDIHICVENVRQPMPRSYL